MSGSILSVSDFVGKDDFSVAVLGLGVSGMAAARLLLHLGHRVVAVDDSMKEPARALWDKIHHDLEFRRPLTFVQLDELAGEDIDALICSPGFRAEHPAIASAISRKIPIYQEIELGAVLTGAQSYGVTGTNGKTTVTALAAEFLVASGIPCIAAGNIGVAASDVALRIIKKELCVEKMILELSSFQLAGLRRLPLSAAVMTNIVPDHIDWHGSYDAYRAAKNRIWQMVVSGGAAYTNAKEQQCVGRADIRCGGFGIGAPVRPGAWVEGTEIICNDIVVAAVDDVRLPGMHNLENILAALALVSTSRRFDYSCVQRVLGAFGGVPHRLEKVAEKGGVAFINDSKSTNVASAVTALNACESHVILMAGGRIKDESWEPLLKAAVNKVSRVIIFGECTGKLVHLFQGACDFSVAETFEDAFRSACRHAVSGDTILLSPACASYDMFRNFEERGDRFRELVNGI